MAIALRARRQRFVDDLADEAAREVEIALGRAARARRAHEEPGLDQLFELVAEGLLVEELLEDPDPRRAAEHRGIPERALRLRAEPIDPSGDDVARGGRDVIAGLTHGLRELLDEQRVAAAAREDGGDVLWRRHVAEAVRDQRTQLATDEVADRQHHVDRGRGRALGATREDEQLGARRGDGEGVSEDLEARAIGEVDILDHRELRARPIGHRLTECREPGGDARAQIGDLGRTDADAIAQLHRAIEIDPDLARARS